MMYKSIALTIVLLSLLVLGLQAQPLFTFAVDDLQSSGRIGNWVYDLDNPAMNPMFQHDGNHFTFSPAPAYLFHYYAERFVGYGPTTTLTCTAENTPLANAPGEITIQFSQFDLVSFRRVNTVNPAAPWDTPGQAGDERVYANSNGTISFNGTPVLYLYGASFVITTPYPNEAQLRALNPATATWMGSIGTGAPQTGYGFGELDLLQSDPAWAALFAASNYKVDMVLDGVTFVTNPLVDIDKGWYDFDLHISPAAVPFNAVNATPDLSNLPEVFPFPEANVEMEVLVGVETGATDQMRQIYLNEVLVAPLGAIPVGLDRIINKHWKLGSTMETFNVNLKFNVNELDFAKAPVDWRLLYRPYDGVWTIWNDYVLLNPNSIQANNVNQIGEFTVAAPLDVPLPVTLSYFNAHVNAQNLAEIAWVTASESDLHGFKIYAASSTGLNDALCLTPNVILASNSSSGSSYSYVATEITEPGTWYFWLESIAIDGNNSFFGPINISIGSDPQSPSLPDRSSIGAAYPNPFRAGQSSSFDVVIKASENGTVNIYNIAGQLVASYKVDSGSNRITWNGLDGSGKACASGVYLYKLNTGATHQTRKLMLMK
jgi:hypothetical protein